MIILAIGAHFDDLELGCGGSLAKHVQQGDRVVALVITNSKYANHMGEVLRPRETALAEGRDAAAIIGYEELICAEFTTLELTFNNALVETINRVVDDYQVDMIYTHWDQDVHQDHQAVGRATLAAGRKVNRMLMYRSNLYLTPHQFFANYYRDISNFIEVKMQGILAHRTEVEKFGAGWLDFWRNEARNNGQRMGVPYAEAFQLVKYLD
ncbi:MAG: PIG-L family deacetylase [Deltaproteobacteria bacterium]|nr:PIG-L family deacetylase [Deltaproteobacteria bacterium]